VKLSRATAKCSELKAREEHRVLSSRHNQCVSYCIGASMTGTRNGPRTSTFLPHSLACRHHYQSLPTQPIHTQEREINSPKSSRSAILAQPDSWRGTGGYDITRPQAHKLTYIAHKIRHSEYHVLRRGLPVPTLCTSESSRFIFNSYQFSEVSLAERADSVLLHCIDSKATPEQLARTCLVPLHSQK
jgi:hypothetical protein